MSQSLSTSAKSAPNDGSIVPAVGTFQSDEDNSQVEEVVLAALKHGYRHTDTAAAYGNEKNLDSNPTKRGFARKVVRDN